MTIKGFFVEFAMDTRVFSFQVLISILQVWKIGNTVYNNVFQNHVDILIKKFRKVKKSSKYDFFINIWDKYANTLTGS